MKRQMLVHNGRFPKSGALYCSQNTVKFVKIWQTLVELKSYYSFWMYAPLWTSLLVAMHDDIENRSVASSKYTGVQKLSEIEKDTTFFLVIKLTKLLAVPKACPR